LQVNEIHEIDGVEKDFLSWCRLFNQKPETIRSRMSLGSSLDDALHTFSNKRELLFKIDDEIHPLQHWCRIYCINFATVLHRLERGWSIVESFTKPIRKTGRPKKYFLSENSFTLEELSVKFSINQSTIKDRIKTGESLHEALDIVSTDRQKPLDKDRKTGKYTLYTLEGKTMTLCEWCNEKNINILTVQKRLRNGYSFSDAISTERFTNARTYSINNQDMTLAEIEEVYGISARIVYKRIHELGYTIEDAISNSKGKVKYLFDGEYLSVPQISKRTNVSTAILYRRLKKGMSVNAAISTPAKKNILCTIDGQELTLGQISTKYNISYTGLYKRVVYKGNPIEQAVNDMLRR